MKKFTQSLSLISLFAIVLISCKLDGAVEPTKDPTKDPGTDPTPEYYISFKADGITVTETEVTATRGATASPRTLTIAGTAKSGAAPKFKFYTEESFIGFVKGLNIGNKTISYPTDYLEYTNSGGTLYSTQTDDDGILVFLSDISYTNGGVVTGTFNGSMKTAAGAKVTITDGKFNVKFGN
ncbi:MAG: hypothetical protein V4577_23345 [Bacteroidota bacterium]